MQPITDLRDTHTNGHAPPATYQLRVEQSAAPFEYTDPYLDVIWTPIVGACATSLLRFLTHTARANPDNPSITNAELANLIGVSSSRSTKALTRLARHSLITLTPDRIAIPSAVQLAPEHRIAELSEQARTYAQNRHATIRRHTASQ